MRRAGIVAFAFFVFAGNFKTIPPFSALPVDLTLLLALLSLGAAAYVCVTSGRIPGRALLVAAFFWLLILPGTIDASSTVYGTEKVQRRHPERARADRARSCARPAASSSG